ncbi:VWA domain-containing protein [bacterium]|nr:VWA domain-containing protein [bacterium]
MIEKPESDPMLEVLHDLSHQFSVLEETSINERFHLEIENQQETLRKFLKSENPFTEKQLALRYAKKELDKKISTIESLEQDFHHFRALANQTSSRIDEDFWLSEFNNLKNIPKIEVLAQKFNTRRNKGAEKKIRNHQEELLICRTLLLQQWNKLLDTQYSKWEIEEIQKFRQKLWNELKEWLEILQKLADTLEDLSIEPGLLFDLSKDNFSLSNLDQLKRWVEYISNDKGVKELCDMLGRLRRAENTQRQELVKNFLTVTEYVPDINSREEIIGVYLGKDIEHALPQEIALLADDETSILFDMKLVEGRLMCFEMEGMQKSSYKVEEEHLTEVEEEEKLGPIIICVDTSGSMEGSPETIAKAVTLFMATRAIAQKRNCLLINFSTGIETLDLSGQIGLSKVIEFLQRSFHGGTDVGPALTHAIKVMNDENFLNSDLLIISDFIMASLPDSLQKKITKAKENNNQFYSLSIGDMFLSEKLNKIFDNEWVYNPNSASIHSIHKIVNEI